MELILRLILTIMIAFFVGKLVSKMKLPSILGWLITGMVLGPHALSLMNQSVLDASWYQVLEHILECSVGLMIGTELVWSKIKKSGKAIMITTLTQSLGTFLIVSLVFGVVFYFMDIPLYLAFIFGGIALATAPAPTLSIVREFKTNGPVTKTLIPMAALDDIVGCVVFFTTIAIVASNLSSGNLPVYMIPVIVILPLLIGVFVGFIAGIFLKKERNDTQTLAILIGMILLSSLVGFAANHFLFSKPVLNFMLIGMAFSATFSNMVKEERLEQIVYAFNPILGLSIIVVILNLGAPLDYHLILGAGIFTIIYIVARAFGKYFGAYFGASITKSPNTVKKYLGFTLLPHSGVSLVFTGIAVSILSGPAKECADIIQGTIAAAAVINEVIAVIVAKKGFEWAGEFRQEVLYETTDILNKIVITINHEYGSGGLEIGKKLSKELGIPLYDDEIMQLAKQSSTIDQSFFEQYEQKGEKDLLYDLSYGVYHDRSLNDKVFEAQSRVIHDLATQGACIIIGRCADYVLREQKDALKVFLYSDLEKREERVCKEYHISKEKVTNYVTKIEKSRSSYYKQYTGNDFYDMANYNICLDSDVLGIDSCVAILKEVYKKKEKEAKN